MLPIYILHGAHPKSEVSSVVALSMQLENLLLICFVVIAFRASIFDSRIESVHEANDEPESITYENGELAFESVDQASSLHVATGSLTAASPLQ